MISLKVCLILTSVWFTGQAGHFLLTKTQKFDNNEKANAVADILIKSPNLVYYSLDDCDVVEKDYWYKRNSVKYYGS
jgi:hypothetical protein